MEWVRELFATAVLAVLFSFVVAKLVSVAMAGDEVRDSESEPGKGVDRASVAEDVKFEEARLSSPSFKSEKGVQSAQETAGKVHRFQEEVVSMEEAVDPVRRGGEIGAERDEAVEESSVAVELQAESEEEEEEKSVGASELIVEKEGECRCGGAKEDDHLTVIEGKDEESQPHEPKCWETATARAEQSEHELEQIDKEKEVFRVDSDDDGWEGIERSELEKKFAVAAKFVDDANMDDRVESVGGDVKMQLYGLHKVATEGPCHEPQPMALMVSARAKWNAWQRLGNMNPDAAMERYISLLAENIPDWEVARTADENKLDVAMPGAQDYNLSTISCDQFKFTNLREPSIASVTGQIDPSKDENQ